MKERLAATVTGLDELGNEYTIHGYKVSRQQGGQWVEERLISIARTEEGEQLLCTSEEPLTFLHEASGTVINCEGGYDDTGI